MMKKFLISTAVGAMLVAGGVATAQSNSTAGNSAPPPPNAGPRHLPGDTNGNGKVTKAELTASLQKKFARWI